MPAPELYPLAAADPPKIGGFWLDARVAARESGVGFLGHSTLPRGDGRSDVLVIQLNDGASRDPAARDRFAGLIDALHIDAVVAVGGEGLEGGHHGRKFVDHSDGPAGAIPLPPAPWVALAADGTDGPSRLADEILAEVQLADVAPQGEPSGPDYELPWIHRVGPGLSRVWPLPWPGRFDRAGWVTILISWLLTLLIAALGVLIAILLFKDEPPQAPPPMISPSEGGGEGSGSPPPPDPSDSPEPGEPTEDPGGSESPQESDEPQPEDPAPGEDETAPGAPTTRSRL